MSVLVELTKHSLLSSKRRKLMVFLVYIQPLLLLLLYGWRPESTINIDRIFSALLVNCWSIQVFSTASDSFRDRITGFLNVLMYTPTNLLTLLIARTLANILITALSLIYSLLIILFFESSAVLTLSLIFLYSIVTAITMSIVSVPLSMIFLQSKYSQHYINFIEFPVFIISGIASGVSILPVFLQPVALYIPFGNVAELFRSELSNSTEYTHLSKLLLSSVFLLVVTFFLFRYVERKIRKFGYQ